jgi:hypothetical protein
VNFFGYSTTGEQVKIPTSGKIGQKWGTRFFIYGAAAAIAGYILRAYKVGSGEEISPREAAML